MQRSGSWIPFVLLVLLSLLGCAGGRATIRPTESGPVPDNPDQLRAAVLRAEDRRVVDDALSAAIRHESAALRGDAIRALGRIGEDSALPTIQKALKDRDADVRAEAAEALGLLGRPESLGALRRAGGDKSALVRARVAWAIGAIGANDGADLLITLLADDDPGVAAAAGFAAARLPEGGSLIDPLISATGTRDPVQAYAAAYALSRLSSRTGALDFTTQTRVREMLMDWGRMPSPAVRELAARGLMVPSGDAQATVLGKMTVDPIPAVRIEAVRSFAFAGAPVEPFLSKTIEDEDERVVLATLLGFGRMRGTVVMQALFDFPGRGAPGWMDAKAIEQYPDVDRELGSRVANGLSRDERPEVRRASALLIEGRTDDDSLEIARRLLDDEDPEVHQAAIPTLAGAAGSLTELYGESWQSDDPGIQLALARAIGIRRELPDRSPAELAETEQKLLDLWERGASSFAVARAVLEAAGRGAASPGVRPILEQGLGAADPYLRRLAAGEFERLFGEDRSASVGASSDEPLEYYVDLLEWAATQRAAIVTLERSGFPRARFTVRLDSQSAPFTCRNFVRLAEEGYFDGMEIRDVIPNRALQIGDPSGDGVGGPRGTIRDEPGATPFPAGTVAMVRPERDSAGGRWFVALSASPQFEGRYTAFGNVVQNLPGVAALVLPGDRVVSIRVYEGDGSEPLSSDGG